MKTLSLIIETRITDIQREHLRDYTKGSTRLNDFLWSTHKKEDHGRPEDDVNYFVRRISHIDKALNRQKTTKDQTLYSGSMHDPRELKNSEGIVHHPAYLSTSKDRAIGARFAMNNSINKNHVWHEHILAIHVPKGSKAVDISRMKNTYEPTEKEVLLPRGSNLQYHHTETTNLSNDRLVPTQHHVHHMSLIPRD